MTKSKFVAFSIFVACSLVVPAAIAAPAVPKGYVMTDPVVKPVNKKYKEGLSCADANFGWAVVGYLKNNQVGYINCDMGRKKYVVARGLPKIDQKSLRPLVKTAVSSKSLFGYTPQLYIQPVVSKAVPKTEISPTDQFSNITPCRLEEVDNSYPGRPHMASGFPMPIQRAKLDDQLVVQVVPVDFADLRTSSKPATDLKDATTAIEKFWERQSTAKVDIVLRVPNSYIQMPKKVADYNLSSVFPNFDGKAYAAYVDAAVAASDAQIDFTGVDVVILAHTPKATAKQIGTFIAEAGMPGSNLIFETAEGPVYNTMIQGGDTPRDIQNWIHEFGHMLGVTDSGGVGNMGFDVMLWYGVPELTVWNRFVLGVEKDSQINCVTGTDSSTHWIRPVAWPGEQIEGVVIPLSKSKAIVVESRRRTGYDAALGKESEGALVYTVDTSKSGNNGSGPFTIIGPKRMKVIAMWSLDAPLKQGESVVVEGWRISNLESGAFGDVMKVERSL